MFNDVFLSTTISKITYFFKYGSATYKVYFNLDNKKLKSNITYCKYKYKFY